MAFTDAAGHPLSGVLPLQHRDYNKPDGQLGAYDIDYRAHKRVVRVVARKDTSGGLGHWVFDQDATGDLVLGLCWPNQKDKRPIPMWSFGFPTVITSYNQQGTPTPGAGPAPVGNKASGPMQVEPIQAQPDSPDGRMVPIDIPVQVMRAKGQQGLGGANGPNGDPGAAGPAGQNSGGGKLDPSRIDPLLPEGVGFHSQFSKFSFGGKSDASSLSGLQGVGSGFKIQFTGVKTDFGGSGFPQFSGVRTDFSNGSPAAGATFIAPTNPPKQK